MDSLQEAWPTPRYVVKHRADWDASLAEIKQRIDRIEKSGLG